MKWSWSENQSFHNMQRTIFCLILMLVPCGGEAAEFSQLSERAVSMAQDQNGSGRAGREALYGYVRSIIAAGLLSFGPVEANPRTLSRQI
jgi:hypothetical protein